MMLIMEDKPRKKPETLDLTNPADARKFFREFRDPMGRPIELLTLTNGMVVNVLAASDRDICHYASEICEQFYEKGLGFFVEETIH